MQECTAEVLLLTAGGGGHYPKGETLKLQNLRLLTRFAAHMVSSTRSTGKRGVQCNLSQAALPMWRCPLRPRCHVTKKLCNRNL